MHSNDPGDNIRSAGPHGLRRALAVMLAAVLFAHAGAISAPPSSTTGAAEFEHRRSRCKPGDLNAQWELAAWALEHNMLSQADQIYRAIIEKNPEHAESRAALWQLSERRTLPADSAAAQTARKVLPSNFVQYQSKRFVILSDAEPALARLQLELLERAHHQFQRFTTRLKLEPLPLQNKLVCVLFAQREGYQAFARDHDAVTNDWITGYYSPVHDWIVFYNGQGRPEITEALAKLEEYGGQIEQLKAQAAQADSAGRSDAARAMRAEITRAQKHLNQQREKVDAFAAREGIATIVHEAVHQLLFHTRVQTPRVRYPLWISEGLATSFETDSPQQAFGPDHPYAPRRDGFVAQLQAGNLLPMRELISFDRGIASDQAYVERVYQQSYALLAWMSRFRKAELRTYLMTMLKQSSEMIQPQDHVKLFEQAFGDAQALEQAWLRHERSQAGSIASASIR